MPNDPQDVQELFLRLVELRPADRPAALDRECGADLALRQRVEGLLEAHEGSDSLLDRPSNEFAATVLSDADNAAHTSAAEDADEDQIQLSGSKRAGSPGTAETNIREESIVGAVIADRYTMVQRIGEGGMGEVWMARQTSPVKRKVALKLIKMGMDSRAVLARFDQERQALALMDHPNIAKVLDGGITPTGQPFFVMELVNGLPLNKFCDEARLDTNGRLELFVSICQAIQHAHQKGIVHRDLKPANILVTQIDGRPVPKVIDFGVAKATSGKLTDESLSTQFGAVVGTLEYMSPEQAGFSGEDIDTRADIYSLGVILYELLTGLRPIDAQRLKQAALTEMIRLVREEEPSKPSTRLSTDASLPSMAALRQTEPKKLMALLRGELDWVVMKCLEKQRDRRYETANALARDIQRYLADEAVEARPPSTGYRMKKFVQRNKAQVMAAGLLLLALIAGIAGTSFGMVRAQQAAEAERLAKLDAEAQKTRAESREQQAIDAVKRFRDAAADNEALRNNPALESLRRTLLKEPLTFFKSLREQLQADNDTRPEALARLASAAFELGSLTRTIGDRQDALRSYEESLAIFERLARDYPTVTEFQSGLADSYNNLGILQKQNGRADAAEASYRRASVIFERLARENPAVTKYADGLADSHNSLGILQEQTGRADVAEASCGRALAIYERLARENPSVPNTPAAWPTATTSSQS